MAHAGQELLIKDALVFLLAAGLVVPILRDGEVIAVIDLDSPLPARFSQEDKQGIEDLATLLSARI